MQLFIGNIRVFGLVSRKKQENYCRNSLGEKPKFNKNKEND